nr:deoxyribose-phosphate aldolase [Maliibacterium massiliense]
MKQWTARQIAGMIDATILKPQATAADVETLCRDARDYHFKAVCVNPVFVPLCVRLLRGSGVRVATVAGFPLGASAPEAKAQEARIAVRQGAHEVDMVIHVGGLIAGDADAVRADIAGVVAACKGENPDAVVKVIIEACLLRDAQKREACRLAREAGADFVKTSTGFSTGGATVDDVALMYACVGQEMQVKAAGGIRSLDDALAMLQAGATRIGTSGGVAIVKEAMARF